MCTNEEDALFFSITQHRTKTRKKWKTKRLNFGIARTVGPSTRQYGQMCGLRRKGLRMF